MKAKLYESLINGISKSISDAFNNQTDFQTFIDAMHGKVVSDTDGPCGDLNDALPALKVTELGLEKMFHFEYSENDETLQHLMRTAKKIGYDHFEETATKNSIEAKRRYQEQHICKRFYVSGTCGWTCTIRADENGWSTEFGMDGNHYEEVQGCSPQENFKAAYKWAEAHYGKLMAERYESQII